MLFIRYVSPHGLARIPGTAGLNRAAPAQVLGKQQWVNVSVAYRRYEHPLLEDSIHDEIAAAQEALAGLVSGKRYGIRRRCRGSGPGVMCSPAGDGTGPAA
jgi:hypothetical protein